MNIRLNQINIKHQRKDIETEINSGYHSSKKSTDYACFAIWEDAKKREEEILNDIQKKFKVLGDYDIEWSTKNYTNNICRIYQKTYNGQVFSHFSEKIGKPPFKFIIVEDSKPIYKWHQSVSGKIEICNNNIVEAKRIYRSLFNKDYLVHSSNNAKEFWYQASLILGEALLDETINSNKTIRKYINKDLEGADGWDSWHHLFSTLYYSTSYLILRGFHDFPNNLEGDLDFLCPNFQELASSINMIQSERLYKGKIIVSNNEIKVDIRHYGDGYFPILWQKDMMMSRSFNGSFYIPSNDHYFFSILYHAAIHKRSIPKKYIKELSNHSKHFQFDFNLNEDSFNNKKHIQSILRGFFEGSGYKYEPSQDPGVYKNLCYINALKSTNNNYNKYKGKLINSINKRIRKLMLYFKSSLKNSKLVSIMLLAR